MGEWLTIWEMFSKLKDGEVAVSDDEKVRIMNFGEHTYYKVDQDGNYLCQITLMPSLVARRWLILPRYVTFEKAYEAGKQGKVINFHANDGVIHRIEHFDDSLDENGLSCYCLRELIEGNWSVED